MFLGDNFQPIFSLRRFSQLPANHWNERFSLKTIAQIYINIYIGKLLLMTWVFRLTTAMTYDGNCRLRYGRNLRTACSVLFSLCKPVHFGSNANVRWEAFNRCPIRFFFFFSFFFKFDLSQGDWAVKTSGSLVEPDCLSIFVSSVFQELLIGCVTMALPVPDPVYVLRGTDGGINTLCFQCSNADPDFPILYSGWVKKDKIR